jgi:hypothetical protein
MTTTRPAALLAGLLVVVLPLASAGVRAQCALDRIDVSALQLFPDAALLGQSVDLSGDRVAFASFRESIFPFDAGKPPTKGAVYVHRRLGDEWVLEARLYVEGLGPEDSYGYEVALDGDVLAVGVPGFCVGDPITGLCPPGRVVVFEHGARGWELATVLQPEDSSIDDMFGESIDLSGERMLVGAYGHTDVPGETHGAAYVFERVAGTWTQVARLAGASRDAMACFGMGVAIDGDLAAVSAPGEVTPGAQDGALYVYERIGGLWTERARLELPHWPTFFGTGRSTVAVSGRRVVLGGRGASQVGVFLPELLDGVQNGAAFVVEESGGTWTHVATLRAGDAEEGAAFGAGVAADGDRVLVGATWATGITARSGAAYLYEPTPLGWAQTARFYAPDAAGMAGTGDRFGFSVAIDGGLLAFGAPDTPTGPFLQNGAVYTALAADVPCPGQSLSPATELLSMAGGGSQVLRVQSGAAQAGRTYLLLGSLTGTEPGFGLAAGAVHVPLVPDPYFHLTLGSLGGPPFVAGLGVLDADGVGTARFDLPPGVLDDPALHGLALHHAALVYDTGLHAFTFATNPARLRLIP